jgi:hypothetical protein
MTFENFKVYKKESKCNIGEWNRVIIDKPYIMEVCASRDFIDKYINSLIFHGFDRQKIIFSVRNRDLIDDAVIFDSDTSSIDPSNVCSELTLVCESTVTLDQFVEWLTEMI